MARDAALEYLDRRMRESDRRAMLRPLASGERLDLAMRVYRAVGLPILRQTAVPMVMVYLVVAFYLAFVFPRFFLTRDPDSVAVQAGEAAFTLAASLFVALPLLLQGASYAVAVVTRLTADCLVGEVPDEGAAAATARRLLPRMVLLNLRTVLSGAFVLFGALALLLLSALLARFEAWFVLLSALLGMAGIAFSAIAMLIVVARHSLAPAALVLEKAPPGLAVRRSLDLLRHQNPHGSGYDGLTSVFGLTAVLAAVVGIGFGMAFGLVPVADLVPQLLGTSLPARALQDAAERIPWFLALWLATPAWAVATTILYLDRRIRLEGYDIDILQQDVRRSHREGRFQL
jgi:hypothetical protein